MKTAEIGTGELRDSSVEVGDLTNFAVPFNENMGDFLGGTTVMSRGRCQDVIDPYRICKDLQQAHHRLRSVTMIQSEKLDPDSCPQLREIKRDLSASEFEI